MIQLRPIIIPLQQQPESQPPVQGPSQLAAALFTCSICGKGFDQKRRQTRHTSYCRKSKSQPLKSRKKACVQCTKARSQCDVRYNNNNTKHPQCARCQTKGIDCLFDRPPFVTQVYSPPSILESKADGCARPSPLDSYHGSASDLIQVLTGTTSVPDPWIESTRTREYDELMSEFGMFEMDIPAIYIQNDEIHRPPSPLSLITAKPPRSFQPNNESDYGLQLTRRYVVSVLRSYPNMLAEHHIPPFIHHSYSFYEENSSSGMSLPGPLSVCAGIIQMFSFKNKSNTSFIWGTIRTEQERLAAECSRFDDIELLAALQAIALYMLLRISEEDEEATNFDIPLIQTMIDLSVRIIEVMAIRRSRLEAQKTMWHDWSFTESLTRTSALLCLVDLLYDLSGGNFSHHCDGSTFARLTLPCSKKQWNASSEVEWVRETHRELREPYSSFNLTYGDILDLQRGVDRCGKRLDNWLSQVDEFGSLIVAASNLTRRKRRP